MIKNSNQTTYKIILSYKGTHYCGWQYQTVNTESIQNYVQKVIADIINHAPFKLMAASRTDTGVHARGQVLRLDIPRDINPEKLKQGMNSKLPDDIRVKECFYSDDKFNPNKDALSKEYHYYFSNKADQNPLLADIVFYKQENLTLDIMKMACKEIIGKHDFKNFASSSKDDINTIRTISECSIETTSFYPFEDEVFYLKIKGNGFLKYMIRFIMGSLIEVGSEKMTIKEFKNLLTSKDLKQKSKKAPPQGLHLIKVFYS